MRISRLLLAVAALAMIGAVAQAGVVSEDVTYWLDDGAVWWNPSTEALQQAADKLVLKVQQTVYDNQWTRLITGLDTPGYLFAYTITNLTYLAPEGQGMKIFGVGWGVSPINVAVSPQTIPGWVPSVAGGVAPVLVWTQQGPGLMPGSTVELWAVAPTHVDVAVPAMVAGVPDPSPTYPFLRGETSGPVSEPGALAALAGTLASGTVAAFRKRRK